MATFYDVVVIGAGPAGSTVARSLAETGLSVLLLEKQRLPRDKPCGGGLTPRAWRQIAVPIDDLVLNRSCSVQVKAGPAFVARFRSPGSAIWMVRRRDLDQRLAEEAARRGADLHENERVLGLEKGPEIQVISEKGRYRAGVVVGADGAESPTARWLGLPAPRRPMVALEDELEVAGDPLRGEAVVDLSIPHGYAWIFPKGDVYNVGIGTFHRGYARQLRWRLAQFVAQNGLPLSRPLAPVGHRIPTGLVPGPLHADRALLVGDAAGAADPFFGEGISYALLTGEMASRAIATFLAGHASDLSSYTCRVRDTLGRDSWLWRATAALVYRFPALSLRILARSHALQRQVDRTIRGEAGFARLPADR